MHPWPPFSESTSMGSTNMLNQKPAPQAKFLHKQIGPFLRKTGGGRGCVSVCFLCSALGVVVRQKLFLQLLQTQEHNSPSPLPPAFRAR